MKILAISLCLFGLSCKSSDGSGNAPGALAQRVAARSEIMMTAVQSNGQILDYAVSAEGRVIAVVRQDEVDRLQRSDGEVAWDLGLEGKKFVTLSNVFGQEAFVAITDQGCEWTCRPQIRRFDFTTGAVTNFATIMIDAEELELDGDNRPKPGTGEPGGFVLEDYPTQKVLQTDQRVYVLMLTTAYTLKLVAFDREGTQIFDRTIVPRLSGRGGIFSLRSLFWEVAEGLAVTISDFEDGNEPPASRSMLDRYAEFSGVPLSGPTGNERSTLIVRVTPEGEVLENRVVYAGEEDLSMVTAVPVGDGTVLVANVWGDVTAPRLVTFSGDDIAVQRFELSDGKDTFEYAALLPSGDLIISAGYGFQQAATGSITKDDDAMALLYRQTPEGWQEVDRSIFAATAKRDSLKRLDLVGETVFGLGYANGPLTHDTENYLETRVWRF